MKNLGSRSTVGTLCFNRVPWKENAILGSLFFSGIQGRPAPGIALIRAMAIDLCREMAEIAFFCCKKGFSVKGASQPGA